MSYQKYTKVQETVETNRQLEYRVFGRVISQLKKAQEENNPVKIIKAVSLNRDLWSVLQNDVVQAPDHLPSDLKSLIVTLSVFVEQYTVKVINEDYDISILIDINMDIMAGLGPVTEENNISENAENSKVKIPDKRAIFL